MFWWLSRGVFVVSSGFKWSQVCVNVWLVCVRCVRCVRCEFGSKQPFLKRLFHVRKLIHMEKLQLKITTFREIFNCDMSLHVISNTNSALTPSAPNELQGCQL
jgi:hypothetical protein